jgi:diguanylate cyclase (GGDEF)-like protein/PAS domain S-box-containing protein
MEPQIHTDEHRPTAIAGALRAATSFFAWLGRKATGAIIPCQAGDRPESEDAIRNNDRKYQVLFESSDDATIVSTFSGRIIECNPCVNKIFGYSREEVLGMTLAEIVDPGPATLHPATRRIRRNEFTLYEGIGKGKCGSNFPVEVRSRLITLEDEQFVFSQIQDISVRKQLEEALAKSLSRSRSFYDTSRSLLKINHVPDMLQSVSDGIAAALPADRVITIIFDRDLKRIVHYIRGGKNIDQVIFVSLEELRQGLTGWVLQSGVPALSPKGKPDRRESARVQKRRLESNSGAILVVPVTSKNGVIGTITAVNRPDQASFTRQDAELMMAIANQVAIILETAFLFEEAQRRVQEAETLRDSSTAVTATLHQDETIERILEQLAKVVPYDSASVQLLRDGYLEIVGGRGWADPQTLIGIRFPVPGDNPNTRVILDRKPHFLGDASAAYSSFLQEPHSHINSWLGVPLIAENQVIGMLALDSVHPDYYAERHVRQLSAFADQVATALKNAKLHADVQRMAITDSLTGLLNRRGLFDLGQRELDRARRYKRPLAAILLDIDYFKQINDTFSHAIGDQVLKELALRCRKYLRDVDILGRYGGEEFAILLPETDEHSASLIAERLREAMTEIPVQTDRGPISMTISLGIAVMRVDTAELAVLLDHADTAMYAAKQAGRNKVAVEQDPAYLMSITSPNE